MTPERLRELREHIESMSWTHAHDIEHANAALAIIDAELAKPEVCQCEKPLTAPGAFIGDGASVCINCGKRVEVV